MHKEIDGERDGERKGVIDTIVEMKKERKEKKICGWHSLLLKEAPSTSRGLSSRYSLNGYGCCTIMERAAARYRDSSWFVFLSAGNE